MKKQWSRNLFLAALLLALLFLPLSTLRKLSLPGTDISFYENRRLASPPDLSLQTLWDGSFWTELDTYLSDHFVFRNTWIQIDTKTDLLLHRPTSHKVVVTGERLLPFHGYSSWGLGYLETQSAQMADSLAAIRDEAARYGGTLIYLGLPSQHNYFRGEYPDYMDDRSWLNDETRLQFSQALAARSIPFVDGYSVFEALGMPGDCYSSSDHHYTYRGMLTAYTALMEEVRRQTGLELKIYGEEDLTLKALPNPFLGSRDRILFGQWPCSEQLELGLLKDPIPFTRTDNGVPVEPTLYTLPAEGESVTYNVYMGGDVAETVIQTDRPELPKLLIWGDSFTNAMETLLWTSFDETRSLDYRYYSGRSLSEYIADYQPDVVICIRDDSSYLSFEGNGALS